MTITELLNWCFINNVELKIEHEVERLSTKVSIRKFTNGRIYEDSMIILFEHLMQSKVEDPGAHMIQQMIERFITYVNNNPHPWAKH